MASLAEGSEEGFERALEPRELRFPEDHGPHPDFRTEWWYLTGNLAGPEGDRFGFQLTIFRSALAPGMEPRESPWATRQVYLGHLAITDAERGAFLTAQRLARGAVDLAGARAEPNVQIRVEDWEIRGPEAGGLSSISLSASEGAWSLDLLLTPAKPIVLHGDRGLSRKGRGEGNASFYYSFTRLETAGTLVRGSEEIPVEGLSWMDREWSTSLLAPEQTGWDWFALQLADGRDLMGFRLRDGSGGTDFASGTLVAADGSSRTLEPSDVHLAPTAEWTSPDTGVTYPTAWSLRVPHADLDLRIRPLIPNQELRLDFRYWEGAVEVFDEEGGLVGRGYAELVGYGG